jgi:hypothetical protein
MTKLVIAMAVYFIMAWTVSASVERELVEIKAATMSADYGADLPKLAALRMHAARFSDDPNLGYLADYWSGFASWRIVLNGANGKMSADEAQAHLGRAVIDFESSIHKKPDFADGYASAAAVHGWLAAYKMKDAAASKEEIDAYKRLINRAAELEPTNPRVLWIQAVPYMVLPPERGGSIDKAMEFYRQMLEHATPLAPESPLPDWGTGGASVACLRAFSVTDTGSEHRHRGSAQRAATAARLALRQRHSHSEDRGEAEAGGEAVR